MHYFIHLPVDDAMPERLPHAKLTKTAESEGLMSTDFKSIEAYLALNSLSKQDVNLPFRVPT